MTGPGYWRRDKNATIPARPAGDERRGHGVDFLALDQAPGDQHGRVGRRFESRAGPASAAGVQGSGDAFDHLGEDGLRGGEVEPEGSFAAGPEGGSVHHGYPRVLGDQRAG